jgi:hypothetical protein
MTLVVLIASGGRKHLNDPLTVCRSLAQNWALIIYPKCIMAAKDTSPAKRAKQVETAELKAAVLELRRDGLTQQKIADRLGISPAWAGKLLKAALYEIVEEPALEVIKIELERLDWYHEQAAMILKGSHPYVQAGGVVFHTVKDPETGEDRAVALEDVGPKLQAIATLTRIAERRSKLLGIDRPVKEKQENTPEEFAARIIAAVKAIEVMTVGQETP